MPVELDILVPLTLSEDANDTSKSYKPSEADMLFYYERFLPFRYIFQWLSHSPKPTKDFTMREFAYEHRSGIYQRYNSFATQEEFKKSVVKSNPTRFEIGAVYTVNPNQRKNLPKTAMKPESKELVFDIDLTDYDPVRTCCKGTDICTKCWKFIQVATKIIDVALKQDFGFKNLVWVFSGRRGAHCWISDARARNLDETIRKSIVEYLDILGSKSVKFNNKKPLSLKKPYHPHIERSFNIVKNEFITIILEEQDPWLTTPDSKPEDKSWQQTEELLSFLDKSLQTELRSKWQNQTGISSSKSKWEDINIYAKRVLKSQVQVNQLNDAKKEIILYYMYPRLDVEVSRQMIHLLKSPFCVHPSTGNICVPFDPLQDISGNPEDEDYGFNPTHAPNLRQIQNELENWNSTSGDVDSDKKLSDYEKTSLKPYIDYFGKFVTQLMKEELKQIGSKRSNEDPLEF